MRTVVWLSTHLSSISSFDYREPATLLSLLPLPFSGLFQDMTFTSGLLEHFLHNARPLLNRLEALPKKLTYHNWVTSPQTYHGAAQGTSRHERGSTDGAEEAG